MEILLTCHSENCLNYNLSIEVTVDSIETCTAICGGCDTEITDKVALDG
jgi:hypothetical protein